MTEPDNQKPTSPGLGRRLLRMVSWANLVLVIGFLLLLFGISERWWLGAVVTYGPRVFGLSPYVLLLPIALLADWRAFRINVLAAFLWAFAAMECQLPDPIRAGDDGGSGIRIVSCNVNSFKPDFILVLAEIEAEKPDIVLLQEFVSRRQPPSLAGAFQGWHLFFEGEYWIGSRFPIRLLERCRTPDFNRQVAVAMEVDAPGGKIVLVNVHTRTARFGIYELTPGKMLAGEGEVAVEGMVDYQARRKSEMEALREFIDRIGRGLPVVVAGDFNTPESSSLFPVFERPLTSAFAVAGLGYGYTAPCDKTSFLPAGWPWIRVDHLLVDCSWEVASCRVGKGNGSDHRLISAEIRQRKVPEN